MARPGSAALAAALLLATLAGCFGAEEAPEETSEEAPDAPGRAPSGGTPRQPPPQPGRPTSDGTIRATGGPDALVRGPLVVVAHIDTGVNPYHLQFRDDSPLAFEHPSRYLDGFPEDAVELRLSLDAPTYEEALAADADAWAAVEPGTLYWIPGTRIVGAISFGPGGTRCDLLEECADTPILDDHGHGTMTASRSVGRDASLAPEARLVSIEGLGGEGVRWAADQGWIDIQTNSWLSVFAPPANRAPVDDTTSAFAYASTRMLTLAASGNGAAYLAGFAPTPTYLLSTAAPGVVLVGAHDNGRAALWSGAPPHVVADGYGGLMAEWRSRDAFGASQEACCTSAASPYAAGAAAAVLLEARRVVGDLGTGLRDGAIVEGMPDRVPGLLASGRLTLEEFRTLLLRTAEARPLEGPHDGLLHWGASGAAPDPTDPGGNPYCPGCWTSRVEWREVPSEAPAYPLVGYGGLGAASVALATAVLLGDDLPARDVEDAFFALDQALRAVLPGEG